jgi:glycosyltransferase involved in cell wall biosynthesis
MKVVLVAVSGNVDHARQILAERFPTVAIETASREELQEGSPVSRLSRLRARRPDIFAVATERLAWQRGQNALLLFGALAGAHSTIILDSYGGWREEARRRSLTAAPARLLAEASASREALKRAARDLRKLEGDVDQLKIRPRKTTHDDAPRIVYLRTTPGPGTQLGGAASHINGFINAVEKLGARVSLVTNDEIAGLAPGRPLKIIRPTAIGSSRAAFDIFNNELFTEQANVEIAKQNPDFIYQRYSRFSWAGVEASLKTRLPLFLEYNGSEVWVGRHWDRIGMLDLLERYERLNLAAAARVFVVSEVERQNLERAGVASAKIVVNPNGVDTDTFRPGIGGEEKRKALGIGADEILVGFVGSFGPWHGVQTLAEAIRQIPAASRVRFVLVGSGSLLGEVKAHLAEDERSGRVIFTGSVEHHEVPVLLDACDVLVSPHVPLAEGAEFFGSPTKIFEYMAMAKGIVASRLGQIGEVLTHEETALLLEPANTEDLGAAIIRLAESQALREQLGAAARQKAIEHHTWKRNAQVVLDAYRAWLNESE